jgi:hypothetical protein
MVFLSQYFADKVKISVGMAYIFYERGKKIICKLSRIMDIFTLREIFSQTYICGDIFCDKLYLFFGMSSQNNEGERHKVHTLGAQSIAHVRQNLVNCRGNISAHRRRRKLRFFLFERSSAGE